MKKRLLALALLIIGIAASLEAMPRVAVIRMTVPAGSTCPCNPGPYGASNFTGLLQSEGYNVTYVVGPGEIPAAARNWSSVVLLAIAPTNLTPQAANATLDAVRALLESGKRVYLAVFDEYPSRGEARLIAGAEALLCPGSPGLSIARVIPSNPEALAYMNGTIVTTGYTSFLALPGTSNPAFLASAPAPRRVAGFEAPLLVYPPARGVEGWAPLGGSCRSGRGGVLLVADSSIVVNAALEAGRTYGLVASSLIRGLAPPPALVVVDESVYTSLQARVTLRLHPSFLIIQAGTGYARIEDRLRGALSRAGLGGLFTLLAAAVVLLSTWAASDSATGLRAPGGGRRERRGQPGSPVVPAPRSCREILRDMEERGLRGLVRGVTDPLVRREAERLLRGVEGACGPGLLAWLGRALLGWEARASRLYGLLLSLLMQEPAAGRRPSGEG